MGRSIQLLEVTGHCARTSALEAESIIGRQIARPAITTRFPARLKETQCLINALIGNLESAKFPLSGKLTNQELALPRRVACILHA
jgi:hypothetical protein